jgi:hypothetical protein
MRKNFASDPRVEWSEPVTRNEDLGDERVSDLVFPKSLFRPSMNALVRFADFHVSHLSS